jgi:phage baseplate assembly protein W
MQPAFTSLAYPLAIDDSRGRIAQELSYPEHVEQLIKQVLFTAPGERVNRPDFGCGILRMVFAPNDPVTATLAQATIRQALERWLGTLLTVEDVRCEARDSTLFIRIVYALRARRERRILNLEVAA